MNNHIDYIKKQQKPGYYMIGAGIVTAVVGIILTGVISNPSFNLRIITALGLLFIGIGVGRIIKYRLTASDPQAVARLVNTERDERLKLLRDRSGFRAYVISGILAYALLMWVSFADSGSLPRLSDDALWFALVAVVVMPAVVFIASYLYEDKHN